MEFDTRYSLYNIKSQIEVMEKYKPTFYQKHKIKFLYFGTISCGVIGPSLIGISLIKLLTTCFN